MGIGAMQPRSRCRLFRRWATAGIGSETLIQKHLTLEAFPHQPKRDFFGFWLLFSDLKGLRGPAPRQRDATQREAPGSRPWALGLCLGVSLSAGPRHEERRFLEELQKASRVTRDISCPSLFFIRT